MRWAFFEFQVEDRAHAVEQDRVDLHEGTKGGTLLRIRYPRPLEDLIEGNLSHSDSARQKGNGRNRESQRDDEKIMGQIHLDSNRSPLDAVKHIGCENGTRGKQQSHGHRSRMRTIENRRIDEGRQTVPAVQKAQALLNEGHVPDRPREENKAAKNADAGKGPNGGGDRL